MNFALDIKKKLLEANAAYRLGKPIMSDADFDAQCDYLKTLIPENDYKAFRETLFEKSGKVVHNFCVGSLEKLKYEEPGNVISWINDHVEKSLNVSAKVDGISCRIHYSNGEFASATSRGDGRKGEDLTEKVKQVKCVPNTVDIPGEVDIRGELVILKKDFEEMTGFANPRNATAGIMGRDEITKDLKQITFVAYTIFGTRYTKKQQFEILDRCGFFTAWHKSIPISELQVMTAVSRDRLLDYLRDLVKADYPYENDGVVLSDDEYRNEDVLIPENQVAFKVNDSVAETQVIGIEWSGPSKNGKIVPVCLIDPVELAGTIVSKCSLYNIDFVIKNDICPGKYVTVCKFGEIIPGILKVDGKDVIK